MYLISSISYNSWLSSRLWMWSLSDCNRSVLAWLGCSAKLWHLTLFNIYIKTNKKEARRDDQNSCDCMSVNRAIHTRTYVLRLLPLRDACNRLPFCPFDQSITFTSCCAWSQKAINKLANTETSEIRSSEPNGLWGSEKRNWALPETCVNGHVYIGQQNQQTIN